MASSSPFSVLMVSASFHPAIGGAEKQALELSTALRERGVEVRVVTRKRPGLPENDVVNRVPVVRLACAGQGGLLNAVTFALSLAWHLCREARNYQVIHVHLAGSPAVAAVIVGQWWLRKPVFIKLGGGPGIGELAASEHSWSGRRKLWFLRKFKPEFIAVAREVADEARDRLGAAAQIIPNGVDTERYQPVSQVEKAALRQRLGWPEGLCFLYVGRLSPEKRLPQFLEIWAEVARGHRAFLVCVGEGEEEKRLSETASRLRLEGRFFLHAKREDIHRVYAAADIFILPSISEGLSNALLEAMSSGLAVLASRVGGTPDAVAEGKSGLLFHSQDAIELQKQLKEFLDNPGLADKMGTIAREAAVSRYSLPKIAEQYEQLYASKIDCGRPQS